MQQRAVDSSTATSSDTMDVSTLPFQSPDWEDQPPQYKDIVHTLPVSSCKSSAHPVLSEQPVAEVAATGNSAKDSSVSTSSGFAYGTRLIFVPLNSGIASSNGYTNFLRTVRITSECMSTDTDCGYEAE